MLKFEIIEMQTKLLIFYNEKERMNKLSSCFCFDSSKTVEFLVIPSNIDK